MNYLSDSELLIISEILIKIIQNDLKRKTKDVKAEMLQVVEKEYATLKDDVKNEFNKIKQDEFVDFKEIVKRKRGRPRRQVPLFS
jgi:hypothetical protein